MKTALVATTSENTVPPRWRNRPLPRSDRPVAPQRVALPMGIMRESGKADNTRKKPISARDAHRGWTGAMRTSENCTSTSLGE